MKTIALLAVAFLLLAGCATEPTSTRTTTKTVTTTVLADWWEEEEAEQSPSITFSKQSEPNGPGGRLTIVAVQGAPQDGVAWSDISVDTTGCALPDGMVDVGDVILCTTDGPHRFAYLPTNTLLYVAEF